MAITDDIFDYKDKKSVQSCGQRNHILLSTPDVEFTFGHAKAIRVGVAETDALLYLRHSATGDIVPYNVYNGDVIVGSFDMYTSDSSGVSNLVALI